MDTDELLAAVRDGDLRLHELEAHGDADDRESGDEVVDG